MNNTGINEAWMLIGSVLVLILNALGTTTNLSAQSHIVNLSTGYSFALETSDHDIGFGRSLPGYSEAEELSFEDVTPKFGQGLNISLGYEYLMSDHWSLWADFHFLQSSGYTTLDTISVWQLDNELFDHNGGIRQTEFNARNYSLRVGVGFNLNRGKTLRKSRSEGRFYYQLRAGLTYNKPYLTALSTAYQYPGQLDSVHYDTYAKGNGLGATVALKTVYRFNRNWEFFLQVGADWFPYKPQVVFYRTKHWNGHDELNPGAGGFIPSWMGGDERHLQQPPEFPFHNLSALLGVNYVFESNKSSKSKRPAVSSQKHVINLASGYSVALETSNRDVGFGRTLTGYMDGGELAFKDVTPKFGEGLNIDLGYEYLLSDNWSLWSDLSLLRSSAFSTIDTISVWQLNNEVFQGIRNTEFEATNYSIGAGMAFNLNRDKAFQWNDIPGRFYYQAKVGLTFSKANVWALSTGANAPFQTDSVNYDTYAEGTGFGATAALKMAYKISPGWHIYLQVGGDWIECQPKKVQYRYKLWNGIDEERMVINNLIPAEMGGTVRELSDGPVFPFHNISAMLGVSYVL